MTYYDDKASNWREAQHYVTTRIWHMDTGKLEATFYTNTFNIAECANEKLKDYLSEIIVPQKEKGMDLPCSATSSRHISSPSNRP